MKRKTNQKDTPVRSNEPLSFDAAESWKRMQGSGAALGEDLEDHFKDLYRQFLDRLMIYDRQEFLQVQPYERRRKCRDQSNGFYNRYLTSSFGTVNFVTGHFKTSHLWAVENQPI